MRLRLHPFANLSGDQVVELLRDVLARERTWRSRIPSHLSLVLDLSFIPSVGPAHIKSVLELTPLEELIIWDNPGLPLEEVSKVAEGHIAKTTTRACFLEDVEGIGYGCIGYDGLARSSSWASSSQGSDTHPHPPGRR